MITFISIYFLIFVAITLLIYFLCPGKYQWLVLLVSSIFFYSFAGTESLIFIIFASIIAYMTARNMELIYNQEQPSKKKARQCLMAGIVIVLFLLAYAKIGSSVANAVQNIFSLKSIGFQEIIPLGISYYTFSIIGYMADVYWKKQKAEHNYLKFLLYMIYFPQILQGPIPRYRRLAPQLCESHAFRYKSFCYGSQRIIWGYFKKLVIADRLALLTSEVFSHYESYEGLVFVLAILCSAIELYCDFSSCMDIALGISEIMSIHLDENFMRPFFAKSAAEFWHRWHITLGTWFKDYIYMPLVSSPRLARLCQNAKKLLGSRFARSLMAVVPLATVWILTGLWHGTGMNYILWGCYWGILIILSTIFAPEFKKLKKSLGIQQSSHSYQIFQMIRTTLLYMGSRLLTAPGNLKATSEITRRIFEKFNIWILFDETLYEIGLDRKDFWVCAVAILILWKVSSMQERGIPIRDKISSYPLPIRWCIYYAGILSVLIFGIYGSGQSNPFIYMKY